MNTELMKSILQEMANKPDGRYLVDPVLLRTPEGREINHQLELLADAGLAERVEQSTVRITFAGYKFLEDEAP